MDSKLGLAFITVVVVTSGCIADDTETFTSSEQYFEMEVVADHDQETYDTYVAFNTINPEDFEDNPLFDEEGMVEFQAELMCGLMSGIAYDYEELGEEFEEDPEVEDEDIQDEIPEYIWEDYEAESVEVELYDEAGEERLAQCQPDEEELNLNVEV